MWNHIENVRPLVAAAAILLPALAVAWTPYGYGPGSGPSDYWQEAPAGSGAEIPGGSGAQPPSGGLPTYPGPGSAYPPDYPYPGFGTPGSEPYGPGFGGPGSGPYGPGFGSQPPGFPPFGPPPGFFGADQPGFGAPSGSLRISQQETKDAYLLDIQLDGMKPKEIQVSAQGRWISVSRDQSMQQRREETFDEGRGYARSYSFSSGIRRFTLPPDADVAAMKREDTAEAVRIVIPRRRDQ